MQLKKAQTNCSRILKDNTFPDDLYGYWLLNDDFSFFGNYRNFKALSTPGMYLSIYNFCDEFLRNAKQRGLYFSISFLA